MIRFQECVPDYYIEESRDFQVLCRLYDLAFNSLKFNIDSMEYITNTRFAKDTVLPLIGDKFGIYDKESYSNRYLLEALPIALKYKGSLKAVNILINAFLDSQEVFDYVAAYHSKDEESAEELSQLLNRDVKPYSVVIFLSDYPSMTNLHILNEYLRMVIPTGMIVEYMFGFNIRILEKFKYNEHVFLFFTNTTDQVNKSGNLYNSEDGLIGIWCDTNAHNMLKTSSNAFSVVIPCLPNSTYVITKTAGTRFSAWWCKKYPANKGEGFGIIKRNTGSSITITTGPDAKYLCAYVWYSATDTTITKAEMAESIKIKKMVRVQDVSLVKSKDTTYSGSYPEDIHYTSPFIDKVLGLAEGTSVDINSVSLASVSSSPGPAEEE